MTPRTDRAVSTLATAAVLVSLAACSAPGRDGGAAFQARVVRLVVGVSPGGGQDMYARVMAPFLRRHLPGRPTVLVENMPGAGGLIATNYLAFEARADGSTVGLLTMQAPLAQLTADTSARFDVRRFGVIGSPSNDEAVCIMSKTSGIDLAAWRAHRVRPRLGGTNYGSSTQVTAALIGAALDLPFRPVIGYKGTSDIRVAMENGEIDGTCASLDTFLASFEPKTNYLLILHAGTSHAAELNAVPSAQTLVSTDQGRELLDVVSALEAVTRFFAVPPGTPSEIRELLRRAFEDCLADKEFLQAASAANLPVRPVPAALIERRIAELLNLPADLRQRLVSILREKAS